MIDGLVLTLGMVVAAAVPMPLQQAPPGQATPPVQAAAAPATPPASQGPVVDYTFPSGAGLLFFYVTPAKAADFDLILGRIREALSKAETPQVKQQAVNWRIYKSAEAPTDAVVYVFAFDPAITTASYDPLLLLAEVLPGEVQPLYDRLKEAVIKVERMGLTKIR